MKAPPAQTERPPEWYTAAEVARLFSVHRRLPNRWVLAGRFPDGTFFRTPGGNLRFSGHYIRALLAGAR